MKKISFLLLIFALMGCSQVVKTINGEKKPKIETAESLQKFIDENELGIDLGKNLFLKDSDAHKKLVKSELCYIDQDSLIIPYGFLLFNKNWIGINYQEAAACLRDEVKTEAFLELEPYQNPYTTLNASQNLSEFRTAFVDQNGKKSFPFKKVNRPIAVVLWAKYKGKKWAEETQLFIRELQNSKEDFQIYFLNLDPNEHFSQFEG